MRFPDFPLIQTTQTQASRTCICRFSYRYRKFIGMPMRIIIFCFAAVFCKLMCVSCQYPVPFLTETSVTKECGKVNRVWEKTYPSFTRYSHAFPFFPTRSTAPASVRMGRADWARAFLMCAAFANSRKVKGSARPYGTNCI